MSRFVQKALFTFGLVGVAAVALAASLPLLAALLALIGVALAAVAALLPPVAVAAAVYGFVRLVAFVNKHPWPPPIEASPAAGGREAGP